MDIRGHLNDLGGHREQTTLEVLAKHVKPMHRARTALRQVCEDYYQAPRWKQWLIRRWLPELRSMWDVWNT